MTQDDREKDRAKGRVKDLKSAVPELDDNLSNREKLKAKLVMETARLPWSDLQRFYARGQVVRVGPALDLIEVAIAVAEDDKSQVQPWLEKGLFGEVAPEQAQVWFDQGSYLWTVVVAPWVLVQERSTEPTADAPLH